MLQWRDMIVASSRKFDELKLAFNIIIYPLLFVILRQGNKRSNKQIPLIPIIRPLHFISQEWLRK